MSHDILTRARALLNGITPGEWVHHKKIIQHIDSKNHGVIAISYDDNVEDLAFTAATPALVRGLCEEVERLRRLITEAADVLYDAPEINLDNYDEGQVATIDGAATEAYVVLCAMEGGAI